MRHATERRIGSMTTKPQPDRPSSCDQPPGFLNSELKGPESANAPLPVEVQRASQGASECEPSSAQPDGDADGAISPSKSTWNYRVISFRHGEDAWCAIHEVYYDNGVPKAYSSEPAVVMWDPEEGDGTGCQVLDRMKEALGKPVLTEKDFRKEV